MHSTAGNYEAFKALHEARMQSARATAVASGLSRRQRRGPGPIHQLMAWLGQRPNSLERVAPKTAPESLFWA